MKRIYPLLLCGILAFAACNKDLDSQSSSKYDDIVGTYSIVLSTDSLSTDGEWVSNEFYGQVTGEPEPDWYGELTIAKSEDGSGVSILGMIDLGDGSPLPLYQTTAVLDESGRLIIAPNDYEAPSGFMARFTFRPSESLSPLVFHSQMNIDMAGYDFGYKMTNTATKK